MYKLRNNKLGMTLIEMVISLVVLGILTTSTMGIIISSNNIFVSTSNAALDRQVGGYVFETLSSILKYTTHMTIYDADKAPATDKSQNVSIDVTDEANKAGKILYKAKGADDAVYLYADSFYGNRSVQYTLESYGSAKKHIKLTVAVFREGKKRYELSRVIKCVNLALITSGSEANLIKDLSTPGGTNQYISFSVDEKLINGGKDAYSLEYKVAEYMARYNSILNEYWGKLGKVYGEVSTKLGNTENKEGKRVVKTTYEKVITMRDNAVISSGSPVWEDATNSPYNYNNLRKHYQDEIKALLHFTPTAGFPTSEEGTNPYYGVAATKEELYTGFLLEYYSENDKHQKVTKASFPQFTDPDTFFSGTSIASYINNTSGNNQMVILTYYKDNINEDFSRLYTTSKKKVWTYSGKTEVGYSHSIWYATGTSGQNTKSKTYLPAKDMEDVSSLATYNESLPTQNSMDTATGIAGSQSKTYFSIDVTSTKVAWDHYSWCYRFKETPSASNFNMGVLERSNRTYASASNWKSDAAKGPDCIGIFTANATQLVSGSNCSWVEGHPYGSNKVNVFYICPHTDLTQGWYYIKDSNWYHFFYLAADTNNNSNKIAVKAQPSGSDAKKCARIVLEMANTGDDNQYTACWAYAQAKFDQMESGANGVENVVFGNVGKHEYVDYVLYGVDWNSWFLKNPSNGIANKILNGAVTIIDTVVGAFTGNRNFAKQDITEITGSNAALSLGNHGQMTVDKKDTTVASYNMAWTIYSPKRGTWYYLPKSSTRISVATSKIPPTSPKDHPTFLDVDLANGKTWGSSMAMVADIDARKLSSSGLFGLVDTTSDTIWVALPTGNQVEITIPDATNAY